MDCGPFYNGNGNGKKKCQCMMPLPLPSQCEQSHLIPHNPFRFRCCRRPLRMNTFNDFVVKIVIRCRCSVDKPLPVSFHIFHNASCIFLNFYTDNCPCGTAPSITNGYTTGSPAYDCNYSWADYRCNDGYIMNGNSRVTCNRQWETLPTCQRTGK